MLGDLGRARGRGGRAKFKATARKCNHLKGKARRKACWRRAYGK
jgi:hypothetical protein